MSDIEFENAQAIGDLTLYFQSTAKLLGGTNYELRFSIRNGAFTNVGNSDARLLFPTVSSTAHSLVGTVMNVDAFHLTPSVFSSSSTPCSENTITVILTPSSATFPVNRACTPSLTVNLFFLCPSHASDYSFLKRLQ